MRKDKSIMISPIAFLTYFVNHFFFITGQIVIHKNVNKDSLIIGHRMVDILSHDKSRVRAAQFGYRDIITWIGLSRLQEIGILEFGRANLKQLVLTSSLFPAIK